MMVFPAVPTDQASSDLRLRTEAEVLHNLERLQHQLERTTREIQEYMEAKEKRHPIGGE